MNKKILIRHERDPLFGFSADGFVDYLRITLDGRVQDAYLYGSFGTPEFYRHSDIDLMLVCDTAVPFVERALMFGDLRDRVPSLEILVYTPEEFTALTTEPSPGFWRSATSSMRKIV